MYYILNTDFVPIMVLDRYNSFLWTDRYNETGDFEIETIPETNLLNALVADNYIYSTESKHEMIIEKRIIKSDPEEGATLTVSGSSLESILKRRIVWNKTTLSGKLQDGIKQLINENIISPSDSSRKIDNFVFEDSTDTAITNLELTAEYDKDNLYDILNDVCETNKIGFRVTRNSSNQFVFSLYAGKDRTYEQTTNKFVLFSSKFDNLENSEYTEDAIDSINTVLAVGGDNDSESKTVGSYTGLARREGYISAGTMEDGYSGTYDDFLKEKANEELKDHKAEKKIEGEVNVNGFFQFGTDFDVGDIVEIENEYGMRGKVRITEIIFSENDEGTTMYPTFDEYEEEEESTT